MKELQGKFDCAVIGGGVIGCFVARELCAYKGDFLLVEAGNDVAVGTSKANSGIVHAGFDALPGTLKAKYNVRGSALMQKKCRELDVPYKVNGALVLSFGDRAPIEKLKRHGDTNGVATEMLTGDEARALEPKLSEQVRFALRAPHSAIVSPYELTIACFENFIANGGKAKFDSKVIGIERTDGGYVITVESGERFFARAVVNAAGVCSDLIHNFLSSEKVNIRGRRGQYVLLDKVSIVSHTVFQTPTALGKGVLVTPTCHGNVLIGPNAEDVDDPSDTSTTADGLSGIFEKALLSVPTLSKRDIITQFSGVRAVCGDDFFVGESEDGFFEALGICSPGLASSPAIGEHLAAAVAQKLKLDENAEFVATREGIPRFAELTDAERDELIAADPAYGRIICRCENVTEGEIVEAIRRGAVDLDGIKRRVRAGMGRCQAGFCTPNLIKIIARERKIPTSFVTKSGRGSEAVR